MDKLWNQSATGHTSHGTTETPNPCMTEIVHPGKKSTTISCIRVSGGSLTTDPARMADALNYHFSAVSQYKPTDPESIHNVESAIRHQIRTGQSKQMDLHAADTAGSGTVTVDQVRTALQDVDHSSAPGLDGLPYGAWQLAPEISHAILAKVFTTMFMLDALPAEFNHGKITPIYKAGDTADANNYRPITVLNTDYRILARVLAKRFNTVMSACIDKHQAAFLSGRRIADNIHLLQILPHLLQQHNQQAAIAFLDNAKAYDTADREFLTTMMAEQGASPGMIKWVQLLLHNTTAVIEVN